MIRLTRAPKDARLPYTIEHVVGDFEIRWDKQIQAWEIATLFTTSDGHPLYTFRIGRVVDGTILITELVDNTHPAGDPISVRAAGALGQLADRGEDLGEWTDTEAHSVGRGTDTMDQEKNGRKRVIDVAGVTLKGPRPAAERKRQVLRKEIQGLVEGMDLFGSFDVAGVPEEWLPQFCIRLDTVLGALVDFQHEINTVVAGDPHFAAVRQREDLERIELHENVSPRTVLEDGLALSEWAPVQTAAVMRRMIQALDDSGVDLGGGQLIGEDEPGSTVVQGDVAHDTESTAREGDRDGQ